MVDFEAARRQAFGSYFNAVSTDSRVADSIMKGALTLSPHPEWSVPTCIEWDEDPFHQRNWVAQLHMLRWLDPIRRVAMEGNSEAREFWLKTVRSWVVLNKPGRARSKYAWSNMMDGIRALELSFGLPLVAGTNDEKWLVESIVQHGEWMEDERHLGHSNHALHQHQGLLVSGLVLERPDWVDLARNRMVHLFGESYDEQGVNAEGSIGYHKNNFIWWDNAFKRFDVEGIQRPLIASRLELALEELAHATKPNLQFERIGDIDRGGPGGLSSPSIDYVLSHGAVGTPPSETAVVYDRGYVFGRSGWGQFEKDFSDELFYSISYGSAARVHGHQDGGSITLHANGSPWLVDAGKYAYIQDEMRDYCLSRIGHNVVHVEERPYDPESVVALTRYNLSPELDDFELIDDGYEGVRLTRRVIYCRGGDFLVVIDNVRSETPVVAHQRWHLDPQCDVDRNRWGYNLTNDSKRASIQWRGTTPKLTVSRGAKSPLDGWIATDWMKKVPTNVVSATREGRQFRIVTVIGASGHKEGVEFESMSVERPHMRINVRSGRQYYSVDISPQRAVVSVGGTFRDPRSTFDGNDAGLELQQMVRRKIHSVENTAPQAPDLFTPEYWGSLRRWIRSQRNERDARLMALDRLLEGASSTDNTTSDGGRLAAIIDLAGADLTFGGRISGASLGLRREPMSVWEGTGNHSSTYKMPRVGRLSEADLDSEGTIWVREPGGLTLPIAISRGTGDILSVRFHGAVDRAKTSLPLFQGLTSERARGVSHAVVQDPTLDLDPALRLGWYLGRKEEQLHEYIASSIREIKAAVGAHHVLLSGSSGGGFAALQVGAYLSECVILALNPQTSVTNYHAAAAQRAIKVCFNGRPPEDTRLSAVSTYRHLERIPPMVYVQNVLDTHHLEFHMKPFRQVLRERHDASAQEVQFVEVDWGKGHKSASPELYEEYWKKAASLFQK
ncbi:heparinase II/III family protein [Arthrobacter koreensis]|uniref:heparinase II/III domain-containing protein n=1 Tax=Arthrobacter koreensis TaxID=199136 RepID=UPI0036DB0D44